MQRTSRRRAPDLSPDHYAVDHPFAVWYVSYWKREAARCVERPAGGDAPSGDIFMGELAATRFSLGMDDDLVPVLGVAEGDADAVMSLPWTGAALLRGVQRRDWVALSCADARMEGGGASSPVPLRLWLPCANGLLDPWVGIDPAPASIRLVEAVIRGGKPLPKGGAPLAQLALALKGSWEPQAA